MKVRTYSEIIRLQSFEERYAYLRLNSRVGIDTFGFDRYINQVFYKSTEWRAMRKHIIARDNACDLGVKGFDIYDCIYIHHMNPITVQDLEDGTDFILDPEFLICSSFNTHNAIHYGSAKNLITLSSERRKGDTTLWKVY